MKNANANQVKIQSLVTLQSLICGLTALIYSFLDFLLENLQFKLWMIVKINSYSWLIGLDNLINGRIFTNVTVKK